MSTPTVDAGSQILIEVVLTKKQPFSSVIAYDPTAITYYVFNSAGETAATGELTKFASGKYYIVVDTLLGWLNGRYSIRISIPDNNDNTIKTLRDAFRIRNSTVSETVPPVQESTVTMDGEAVTMGGEDVTFGGE